MKKNRTLSTGLLRDYYMNGQLRREGKFLKGMKAGDFREFHPNGQPYAESHYSLDKKTGTWKRYYADGTPRDVIDNEDGEAYVESFWQPDGQLLLDRGNGLFKTDVREDGQAYRLKEKYLNYQKHGMWRVTDESGKILFEEEYKDGVLIRGISFDQYGNAYHYVVERITPQPEKGMQNFIAHLHDNTSFPDQVTIKL
jgi:antitoxin component YwqK of YwqJK toxin-antitoxin module